MEIDQSLLKEFFDYKDGHLVWKKNTTFRNHVGKKAGVLSKSGYVYIGFMGKKLIAHRMIWLWHYGQFPVEIDHVDRCRSNNKIENLREVTRQQNNFNTGLSKNNSSGANGVAWHSQAKKWRAYIMRDYKQIALGLFDTVHEAAQARAAAELIHHK